MIGEFIGLPCAGKSTAVRSLVSKGLIKRSRIEGSAELLSWNVVFLLRHPVRFFLLFYYIVRHSTSWKLLYYKFTNLFLHVNGKYTKAVFLKRAIIDQGFVQNCISLFEKEVSEEEMKKYLKCALVPDEVIVFDTPVDVRKERMKNRNFAVRDMFDSLYKDEWQKISENNYKTLLRILPKYVKTVIVLPFGNEQEVLSERYQQKKIIYAANYRLPTEKAHGYQIAKMCESFGGLGFDVALLVPTKKHNPVTKDIFSYYGLQKTFRIERILTPDFFAWKFVPSSLRFFLQSAWFALAMLFRRIDAEAIYYLRNPELVWVLKFRGVSKVIFEAHMLPKKRQFYKACVKDADLIPCNSKGTMRALQDIGIGNLMLSPNGVDIEAFDSAPKKEKARQDLNITLEKKIVLYAGHLYAWKGVGTLLEAAKLDTSNETLFYFVGGKANEIEKLKKEMGVEGIPHIVFHEHIEHSLIPVYLKAADVVVLPNSKKSEESVAFTSPIKMFEYMASGTPIVAADLPSIREILSEENACFFTSDSALSLKEKIDLLLSDRELAKRLSQSARKDVGQYTWVNRAKNIVTF
ncbi:MAG: glycosyltransferase [Candidatus Paceibacterota bacterium]|jgi:glycosyltransferase involved in cell wall biosynthesis